MNIKVGSLVMLLLASLCLASTGCTTQAQQAKSSLRVGIVYLERVLPEIPEYRQYSDQYVEDTKRLANDVPKDPAALQQYMKDERKKQELEQSMQKWDVTRRKFLDKVLEQVRVASTTVAHDKQIDIVLVDAPWAKVNQRMAVDITTDVLYQIKEKQNAPH